MPLETAYEKYYELLIKGTEEGLNHNDYKEVLELSNLSYENDLYKKYWVALMEDINYLLNDIKMDSKLTSCISPECMDYILSNCYLLPLVITNRIKGYVRPFEEGRYLFLCQFHNEEYPSLEVIDYDNKYRCLACSERGNAFTYLSQIEKINEEQQIIDLLRCIYNLDRVSLPKDLFEISKRYHKTILSSQYKRLLEKGYSLFKANKVLSINGQFIDKMYEDRFYTIHRLELNEIDPFFKYEPNETYKLKLSKEEYQPFIDNVSKKI